MRVRNGSLMLGFLACTGAAAAQTARPQYSAAIEFRGQVVTLGDSTVRKGGLAIRLLADGVWTRNTGWRIEGAYTQAQYNRKDPLGNTPINEYGLEIGGSVRAFTKVSGKWQPYLVGGSLLSLRGSCNVDNAFTQSDVISCGDGQTIRVGWVGGAGLRYKGGLAGWDFFLESRLLNNLTSNGGGRSLAIAFGAGV